MKKYAKMLFLYLILTHVSSFAQDCTPADLSNDTVAPTRSQLYFNDGTWKDTGYCYAFTLANLIGQKLNMNVSPEEIGLQLAKSHGCY